MFTRRGCGRVKADTVTAVRIPRHENRPTRLRGTIAIPTASNFLPKTIFCYLNIDKTLFKII